jgi:hypothetical protein
MPSKYAEYIKLKDITKASDTISDLFLPSCFLPTFSSYSGSKKLKVLFKSGL